MAEEEFNDTEAEWEEEDDSGDVEGETEDDTTNETEDNTEEEEDTPSVGEEVDDTPTEEGEVEDTPTVEEGEDDNEEYLDEDSEEETGETDNTEETGVWEPPIILETQPGLNNIKIHNKHAFYKKRQTTDAWSFFISAEEGRSFYVENIRIQKKFFSKRNPFL